MNFRRLWTRGLIAAENSARSLAGDLRLLADGSQLNRRTRAAWRGGRVSRACYLLMNHQRRRLARRREIRQLVGC